MLARMWSRGTDTQWEYTLVKLLRKTVRQHLPMFTIKYELGLPLLGISPTEMHMSDYQNTNTQDYL